MNVVSELNICFKKLKQIKKDTEVNLCDGYLKKEFKKLLNTIKRKNILSIVLNNLFNLFSKNCYKI